MLLVGYFEGVASERGIAWRCADSLSLREFLGYELTETTPNHSTLSGLRRKLGLPLHRAVFDWVLDVAAREGILKGRRCAVDSTMLQANASMKAEHAVDVDSGVTVAAEVHGADQGDPATMAITALQADEAVMRAGIAGGITEVVADRGYHADEVIEKFQT